MRWSCLKRWCSPTTPWSTGECCSRQAGGHLLPLRPSVAVWPPFGAFGDFVGHEALGRRHPDIPGDGLSSSLRTPRWRRLRSRETRWQRRHLGPARRWRKLEARPGAVVRGCRSRWFHPLVVVLFFRQEIKTSGNLVALVWRGKKRIIILRPRVACSRFVERP